VVAAPATPTKAPVLSQPSSDREKRQEEQAAKRAEAAAAQEKRQEEQAAKRAEEQAKRQEEQAAKRAEAAAEKAKRQEEQAAKPTAPVVVAPPVETPATEPAKAGKDRDQSKDRDK
jgi:hypothetical protein